MLFARDIVLANGTREDITYKAAVQREKPQNIRLKTSMMKMDHVELQQDENSKKPRDNLFRWLQATYALHIANVGKLHT